MHNNCDKLWLWHWQNLQEVKTRENLGHAVLVLFVLMFGEDEDVFSVHDGNRKAYRMMEHIAEQDRMPQQIVELFHSALKYAPEKSWNQRSADC